MTEATPAIRSYTDIRGWFFWPDRALFDAILASQPEPGALVELGEQQIMGHTVIRLSETAAPKVAAAQPASHPAPTPPVGRGRLRRGIPRSHRRSARASR